MADPSRTLPCSPATLSLPSHQADDAADGDRGALDDLVERVTNAADACLTALHVMTAPQMPKAVYLEEVIERVLQYTRFHLQATVYPHYDRAHRGEPRGGQGGLLVECVFIWR